MPRYNPNAPERPTTSESVEHPNVDTTQSDESGGHDNTIRIEAHDNTIETDNDDNTIMSDQNNMDPKPEPPVPETREDVSHEGNRLTALIIEAKIIDALETVYDPEIPVNIYELGLIYNVDVDPSGYVTITMTLTAPSCPAAQTIPAEIEQKIRAIDGVVDVKIDITFDPPWEMSKMSDAARLQLGFM